MLSTLMKQYKAEPLTVTLNHTQGPVCKRNHVKGLKTRSDRVAYIYTDDIEMKIKSQMAQEECKG